MVNCLLYYLHFDKLIHLKSKQLHNPTKTSPQKFENEL